MQVQELLQISFWFKENVGKNKILNHYQNLHNKLNQNAQPNSGQPKQPFDTERENLDKALRKVNLNTLTLEQINLLQKLDVLDLLGTEGIENVKAILLNNALDIATAANKINTFAKRVKKAQDTLNELETVLSKVFTFDDEQVPRDSVLMRVYFQEGAAMKDIVDFKKLGSIWYDIGRGIAMAQNKSPEDFTIVGAQKGSLIIEMALLAGLATSVSTILLAGLKVAERLIEIRKKVEELKSLKLSNKKIAQELSKEAQSEKENGIKVILTTTVETIGLDPGKDGDKITALESSITKLVDFTQQGGAIDFVQPDEDETEDEDNEGENEVRKELKKLKVDVEEIRSLENRIKQLEARNN